MDDTAIGVRAENAEETEQNQVFFAKFLMDCNEEDILPDEKVDKDPFDTIAGNTAVCLYDEQKTGGKKDTLVDT